MPSSPILTEELILSKTKVASLDDVKQLNLWGERLTDISCISKLRNIEVLALASNKITTLTPFASCTSLQELYLRKNSISSLKEVSALSKLTKLHTLWLMDNPCATHPYYKEFVLHCCPSLKQLDNSELTRADREQAAKKLSPKILDEILGRTSSSAAPTSASRPTTESATSTPAPARAASGNSSRQEKPVKPSSAPSAGASQQGRQYVTPRGIPSNSNVIQEQRSAGNNQQVLFTTLQAQRAMLTSIVSLLPELTVESLELLEVEVHERVEKQRQRLNRLNSSGSGNE